MDLAKYRAIFIEESAEHFAEMSAALLELEKDPASAESIDVLFRMAHSIKGMAASLDYESVAALAHAFEDCMEPLRDGGPVEPRILALCAEAIAALEAVGGKGPTIAAAADGTFRMRDVEPGEYRLVVAHDDYLPYSEIVSVSEERGPGELAIRLDPGAQIRGRIRAGRRSSAGEISLLLEVFR